MKLDLEQLHVLDTVVQEGSFSAAARILGRAPSAVSYAIKNLESVLGISLFDRGGHRVRLTAAGQEIHEEARSLLARARDLERMALELQGGWEPKLHIVLDGALPMPPIMRALRTFGQKRLPTRVRLKIEYLSGVPERFARDNADLMILLDFQNDTHLQGKPLPPVEAVLVAHRDHPLAHEQKTITRETLGEHIELVVSDSGSETRNQRLFVGTSQRFELSDFHSKRVALLSGVGFGWLPWHLAAEPVKSGELVPILFEEGHTLTFYPFLVRRRNLSLKRSAGLFTELLQEEFSAFAHLINARQRQIQ